MSIHEKLAKIEALIQRASSEGERQAAQFAKQRILSKAVVQASKKEYKVSSNSIWEKRLFVAICCKYGVKTYRYFRQKETTTCLRITADEMEGLVWPEYQKYAKILQELVGEIMQDLINKIYEVKEEEELVISGEIAMH